MYIILIMNTMQTYDKLFIYYQCLVGDKSDNIISGLSRIGEVTAKKLLKGITTIEEAEKVVIEQYNKQKVDLEILYNNYTCLKLFDTREN